MHDINLEKTCDAFPEQYDAFLEGEQVGYLRLRHGHFSVRYPDARGEEIYFASPKGDGMFDDDERAGYLEAAKLAIIKKHSKEQ